MRRSAPAQRFFPRAFQTEPLASKFALVAIPDPAKTDDASLAVHCKRFVKTNYHPSGTCRMGPHGRWHGRARSNAPAMMMGSRCAELILNG